jgi:hypothetical protein
MAMRRLNPARAYQVITPWSGCRFYEKFRGQARGSKCHRAGVAPGSVVIV